MAERRGQLRGAQTFSFQPLYRGCRQDPRAPRVCSPSLGRGRSPFGTGGAGTCHSPSEQCDLSRRQGATQPPPLSRPHYPRLLLSINIRRSLAALDSLTLGLRSGQRRLGGWHRRGAGPGRADGRTPERRKGENSRREEVQKCGGRNWIGQPRAPPDARRVCRKKRGLRLKDGPSWGAGPVKPLFGSLLLPQLARRCSRRLWPPPPPPLLQQRKAEPRGSESRGRAPSFGSAGRRRQGELRAEKSYCWEEVAQWMKGVICFRFGTQRLNGWPRHLRKSTSPSITVRHV